MSDQEQPKINPLTGKDVTDFAKDVSKDTAKQAIVWTLAAVITKGLRDAISTVTKAGKK